MIIGNIYRLLGSLIGPITMHNMHNEPRLLLDKHKKSCHNFPGCNNCLQFVCRRLSSSNPLFGLLFHLNCLVLYSFEYITSSLLWPTATITTSILPTAPLNSDLGTKYYVAVLSSNLISSLPSLISLVVASTECPEHSALLMV